MASMDIFSGDAFSLTSLSGMIDRRDYVPQFLGGMGLFTPEPVTQSDFWIDERDGVVGLIQTSERGSAPEPTRRDERKARPFKVPRIAKETTLYATEIAGLRAFGTESENDRVMGEYVRRMDKVRNYVELTQENMRLGAIQGIVLDADGSTVIYNYFTEFGITPTADIDFGLTTDTTDVLGICRALKRDMVRASKGAMTMASSVHAVVGDTFFDNLVTHPNVEGYYRQWTTAPALQAEAFGGFTFGGITFHNYRGTDDNSTVAVGLNEAKFFPVGAQEVFSHVMAPADEFAPYVGASGQNTYAMNIVDRDRQAWTRGEVYSYPLMLCKRPEVLRSGVGNT
jgi:hypothetical protein